MMSAQRTPGPWARYHLYVEVPAAERKDKAGNEILSFFVADCENRQLTHAECEANAAFIVESANNYDRVCNELAVMRAEYATARNEFASRVAEHERVCAERDALAEALRLMGDVSKVAKNALERTLSALPDGPVLVETRAALAKVAA